VTGTKSQRSFISQDVVYLLCVGLEYVFVLANGSVHFVGQMFSVKKDSEMDILKLYYRH
jgi:hypothetical protein